MKKSILLFLLFTSAGWAQNVNRKFIGYTRTKNALEISVSDGKYLITPYAPNTIETTFVPSGEAIDAESHAVVLSPGKNVGQIKASANEIWLRTPGMNVRIQKTPFQIAYDYKGKSLLSERSGYVKKDSSELLDFNIDATEALYGGGSRALGLNRRGNKLKLKNQAHYGYGERAELLNFSIPLVLSSKIYALHFDNSAIGELDLDSQKTNSLTYQMASGRKTYQVIAADDWAGLLQNYTALTGRQPLLPRWALGNFSSRFGYHDQDEVEKTIRKFEEDKVPVDAVILDLYWFGKQIQGTLGNLDWDRETFPNPEKMMADLNAKNIKTILITEPFVLKTSAKWDEADSKKVLAVDQSGKSAEFDFYFGHGGIVDIFKPESKTWFWNIYKNLVKQGVGGWWGDLGEPEAFPSNVITAKGRAEQVHNIYGHNWAQMIAEGYTKDFPGVRPFILMRAGSSGSQRFGIVPWSGDVSRSWSGLQSQPEIALGMGMQGIGFMHSDLGGFAGDYFDDELYLRWLQYGVFQPIFRPHAHEAVAPEPVYKEIRTKAKAKKLVELRYQMLPYNYTIAFENSRSGMPLMRPLLFGNPENPNLFGVSSSYLWGPDLLVTPVTQPEASEVAVYFPDQNRWFDWFTDAPHESYGSQNVATTPDHIPVYVRGGAFIPMVATIQNTSAYSLKDFDLHYYFDTKTPMSSGELYNDDGQTPDAYTKGLYEILQFSGRIKRNQLTIEMKSETGKNFAASDKRPTLIIHNLSAKKVSVNGKNRTFKSSGNRLEIPIDWEKQTVKNIKIEW